MNESTTPSPFYDLIVIGASAGGIEALAQLLPALPATFPAPVVVAQHLDPARRSHLAEILSRRCAMRVQMVVEGAAQSLLPGTIYVVPPDRDVEITDSTVAVHAGAGGRPKPSVDRLLTSAAHVYGERVIAVILTGSGSDGALGAQEVKAAGGTVVIEDPETASYPSMPASLAPTSVDLVTDLAHMGNLLADLIEGGYAPVQPEDETLLTTLLQQIHERSGIDFGQYKRPTIVRRLQRRMAATGARTLRDYLRHLQQYPTEYVRLAASFLIKVTEFFRDPEVFVALRDRVLPQIIEVARGRDHQIRIWSAGCATGEEPYSVAMALCELLGDEQAQVAIRIFATDVDERAIAFARRGIYPSSALAQLPAGLKERYFTPVAGGWAVVPKLRNLVVFGEHDLGQRAPFPQVDLVLCRNVLIYFTADLQKRALQLFAYALHDGGYLMLGRSETAAPMAQYFAPLEDHLKIYRRKGERVLVPPLRSARLGWYGSPPGLLVARPQGGGTGSAAQRSLSQPRMPQPSQAPSQLTPVTGPDAPDVLEMVRGRLGTARERLGTLVLGLPMGVAVVDRQFDIQIINSAACQLLGIYRPAIGKDVLHLVERVPIAPLRSALDAAFHSAQPSQPSLQPAERTVVLEATDGEPRTVQLTLFPVASSPADTASPPDDTTTATHSPASPASTAPVASPAEVDGARSSEAGDAGAPSLEAPMIDAVVMLISEGPATPAMPAMAPGAPTKSQETHAQEPPPGGTHSRSGGTGRRGRRNTIPTGSSSDATGHAQELAQELERARAHLVQAQSEYDHLATRTRSLEVANQELMRANLELRQASEDALRRQNEMRADDEEARALNEELQATNEELETLNEELEATTEQLRTTNEDLLARSRDLERLVERSEAQRTASEQAHSRLSAILAQMAEPVLVVDAQGHPIIVNAAYTALFGEPDSTTVIPPMLYDLDGRPLPHEATPQARVCEDAPFRMGFLLTAADGAQRWFEAQGQSILDEHGERLGGVVTIHELTDRTLRSLEELFLQLAVHELRTPLAVVLGLLQLQQHLLNQPATEVPFERLQELTARAVQQTRRLRTLIDDVSDLGRVQSGKLHIQREPVDVVALLRQTVETVDLGRSGDQERGQQGALQADARHPQITLQVAPELGALWIAGDPLRVGQIVTNLLNNALTHAPTSERIEVSVRRVRDSAEISVSDQGPGIPSAELPYLFTPFRQVVHPDPGRMPGLGLGLFLVSQVVRALDGTIEVQSEPGHGATFVVRLPLASTPAPAGGTGERTHSREASEATHDILAEGEGPGPGA